MNELSEGRLTGFDPEISLTPVYNTRKLFYLNFWSMMLESTHDDAWKILIIDRSSGLSFCKFE